MPKISSLFALAVLSLSLTELSSKENDLNSGPGAENVNTNNVLPPDGRQVTTAIVDLHINRPWDNVNAEPVSNPKGAAFGSLIQVNNNLVISGNSPLNNRNTGAISGGSSNVGAFIDVQTMLDEMNTCTLSQGSILNLNEGQIASGVGSGIFFDKNLVLSGCHVSCSNTSSNITGGIGSQFVVTQDLNITADRSVAIVNKGDFNATGQAAGSKLSVSGNMNITAPGSLSLANEGALSGTPGNSTIGAHGTVSGNLMIDGGSVSLNNAGGLTDATGAALDIIGACTLKKGAVSNINQAKAFTGDNTNAGSRFSAASISIEKSDFENENGQVKTTTGGLTVRTDGELTNTNNLPHATHVYGSQISLANGLTVTEKGALHNLNEGTVDSAVKASYGSDILIINNGITMTGGTIDSINKGGVDGSAKNAGASIRTQGTGGLALSGGDILCQNESGVSAGIGSLLSLAGPLDITLSDTPASLKLHNIHPLGSGVGTKLSTPLISFDAPKGTLTLSNSANLAGGIGTFGTVSNTFTLKEGVLNLVNSGHLNQATGVELDVISAFILKGGAAHNINTGKTQPAMSAMPGALFSAGSIEISDGLFENTGQLKTTTGALSISGGLLTNTSSSFPVNEDHVSDIYGSQISAANGLNVTGGEVRNINETAVDNRSKSYLGADIVILHGGMTLAGGALSSINKGAVSGSAMNAGASIRVQGSGPVTLSGGLAVCENRGAVASGVGSLISITGPLAFGRTGFHLSNTHALKGGIGAKLSAQTVVFEKNGGQLLISNIADASSATGCLMSVLETMKMSGGRVVLENSHALANGLGTALKIDADFIIEDAGMLELRNISNLTAKSTGALTQVKGNLSTKGWISLLNESNLTNSSGAHLDVAGSLNVMGRTVQNIHKGVIQGDPSLAGSTISAGNITVQGGSLINENGLVKTIAGGFSVIEGAVVSTNTAPVDSQHVNSNYGSKVSSATSFSLKDAATINNSGSVTGDGLIGSLLESRNGIFLGSDETEQYSSSKKTPLLQVQNKGKVTGNSIGASVCSLTGEMGLFQGTAAMTNEAAVVKGTGTALKLASNLSLGKEGNLSLINHGELFSSAAGCQLTFSGALMQQGGSLRLENEASLESGTGVQATVSGAHSFIAGGTLLLWNKSSVSNAIGTSLALAGDLRMTGGSLINKNTAAFTGVNAVGTRLTAASLCLQPGKTALVDNTGQIQLTHNLDIYTGAVVKNNNTLAVSRATVSEGYGSEIDVGGSLNLYNGTLENNNQADVSGHERAFYGSHLLVHDAMTMTNGVLENKNSAPVASSSGAGSAIRILNGGLNLSGGKILCENKAAVASGIGSWLTTNKSGNIDISNGASIHLVNSGNIDAYPTACGVQLDTVNLTLGGSFILSNSGKLNRAVSLSNAGAQALVRGSLNMLGGNLTLSNTADLDHAVGTALDIVNAFTIHAGNVYNINTGLTRGAHSSPGSRISARTIVMSTDGIFANSGLVSTAADFTISNGTLANVNALPFPINGSTVSSNSGCQISVGGALHIGGNALINNRNESAVNHAAGEFYGSLLETREQPDGLPSIDMGSGNLKILNSGPVTNPNVGSMVLSAGPMALSSGTIECSNLAAITNGGIGSKLLIKGELRMTGGRIIIESKGSVDSTSQGSVIEAAGGIFMTGGELNNHGLIIANSVTNVGGTIRGHGVFHSHSKQASLTNEGTVSPGHADYHKMSRKEAAGRETLTIHGPYTQKPGGTVHIRLMQDAASWTRLECAQAFLDGTLVVEATAPLRSTSGQDHIALITTTDPNGVAGTFNSVKFLNIPDDLGPSLKYLDDQVLLFFSQPRQALDPAVPVVTSYQGGTSYQMLFNMINRNNFRLEREMQRLRNRTTRKKTQETPLAQTKAASKPALASRSSQPLLAASQTLLPQLASAKGSPLASFFNWNVRQKQERLHEEILNPALPERRWNVYLGPIAAIGSVNTKHTQLGCEYWDIGGLAAVDYAFDQVGLGAVIDYDRNQVDVHKHWGKYHFNHVHSSVYATYAPHILPELAFNGIVGGGYEWYDFRRNVPGPFKTANAQTTGGEFDAFFAAEYVFSGRQFSGLPQKFEIIPRASLQYIYIDVQKFKEHNAGIANVEVSNQNAKSLRSGLDIWFKYSWDWTAMSLAAEFNAGWQREYFDKGHILNYTPIGIGGPITPINVFGAGRNTLIAGCDFYLEFYKMYGIELMYDYQWNELFRDNSLYLGFNIKF